MGRKQEGNGIRARIHSAGVQIKVLDQKGVIGKALHKFTNFPMNDE